MESKEERYDPAVNYDSGSDTELNNARDKYSASPPSSPREWSDLPTNGCIFVHNDTGAGRRGGGPLAEKGDNVKLISKKNVKKQAPPPKKRCKGDGCQNDVDSEDLHEPYAYTCGVPERRDQHQVYCLDCAIGKNAQMTMCRQSGHNSFPLEFSDLESMLAGFVEAGIITETDKQEVELVRR